MSRRKQGCVARRYLRRLRATGKREFSAGNVPRSTAAVNLTEVLPKFVTRLMGFWVQRKPWPLITDEPRFSQGMLERKPPNKLPDPLRTFSAGSSAAGPPRNHLFAVKRFGGHRDTRVLRPCPLAARRLSHPGLWMCDIQAPMYRAGGNLWKDGDSLPLSPPVLAFLSLKCQLHEQAYRSNSFKNNRMFRVWCCNDSQVLTTVCAELSSFSFSSLPVLPEWYSDYTNFFTFRQPGANPGMVDLLIE